MSMGAHVSLPARVFMCVVLARVHMCVCFCLSVGQVRSYVCMGFSSVNRWGVWNHVRDLWDDFPGGERQVRAQGVASFCMCPVSVCGWFLYVSCFCMSLVSVWFSASDGCSHVPLYAHHTRNGVCVCARVCVCVCVSCVCVCNVCMFVCMHMCMLCNVCMYVCMHLCMHVLYTHVKSI
eukprot:Tamp_26715.p2 GENE.Tamp_26715~~Tamp_26715.p2  ORF type:complete len:178 (-),score=3.96 Tamp_26715:51-584(-)